uniref:Uncharacterized protein n=1 Tax=Ditylenchus dipsaci TaxID=166011 RepID=A0A915EIM7_9BILA
MRLSLRKIKLNLNSNSTSTQTQPQLKLNLNYIFKPRNPRAKQGNTRKSLHRANLFHYRIYPISSLSTPQKAAGYKKKPISRPRQAPTPEQAISQLTESLRQMQVILASRAALAPPKAFQPAHITGFSASTNHFTALPPNRSERLYPCLFCNGNHWPSECSSYAHSKSRLDLAKQLNECLNCLKPGYEKSACAVLQKQCFSCYEPHHRVFCPKNDQAPSKKITGAMPSEKAVCTLDHNAYSITQCMPALPFIPQRDEELSHTASAYIKPMVCRYQNGSSLLVKMPESSAFCKKPASFEWATFQALDVLQQEQVNFGTSALYRPPAADTLWSWALGGLCTIRNAWVYSSCCLVILLLLWNLRLQQFCSALVLSPGRAPAQRLHHLRRSLTGQNGMDSPALLAKSKEKPIQYTTTLEDQFSVAASKWSYRNRQNFSNGYRLRKNHPEMLEKGLPCHTDAENALKIFQPPPAKLPREGHLPTNPQDCLPFLGKQAVEGHLQANQRGWLPSLENMPMDGHPPLNQRAGLSSLAKQPADGHPPVNQRDQQGGQEIQPGRGDQREFWQGVHLPPQPGRGIGPAAPHDECRPLPAEISKYRPLRQRAGHPARWTMEGK